MDSLKVTVLVSRLQAALKYCEVSLNIEDINPRLIYSAPSIEKTAEHILYLAQRKMGPRSEMDPGLLHDERR